MSIESFQRVVIADFGAFELTGQTNPNHRNNK